MPVQFSEVVCQIVFMPLWHFPWPTCSWPHTINSKFARSRDYFSKETYCSSTNKAYTPLSTVYCLQPSSTIIMSQSISFERTGACLHVMECIRQSEVSKYGRRQFKARSSGRFEALASKCSGFITVEIFSCQREGGGRWLTSARLALHLTIPLLMTLYLVHFIKLDEKGWNETAVRHIRCPG